jgi:large subunit ribosomal protein L25
MQAQVEFKATERTTIGKGGAREARRQGTIPAVIYGNAKPIVTLNVEGNNLSNEYRKGGFMNKIVALKSEKATYFAIPREIQLNPVSDKVEHIDFMHVDAQTEVKVRVPVHYLNAEKSIGIKRGGVLNVVRRYLDVVCNVRAIPKVIDIDVTNVNIGSSIHIKDIVLPEGVKPSIKGRNFTICSITGRGKDEEEAPVAAAAATAAAPAAAAGAKAAPAAAAAKPAAKK